MVLLNNLNLTRIYATIEIVILYANKIYSREEDSKKMR